ncbi:hypothetical protein GCM10022251_74710 [Phytohabitans flavus]|uniref:RNA polymerase sigma factor n=1 Tax=Phytohabitans flavus TaxID=1076124 RepID=A0A6F8XLH8_9ACTN|nr:sigma-70 family RNA polymerase sigma factor [Phytohabitans flavus]BCB74672.1 hypothetical protein Pflav_010820 [Phytohabitans flavus]
MHVLERDLVYAAQAGDVASLGALIERHRASMMATALSVLRDPEDAKDAVQDATVIALRRIGDVRDPDAIGAWLRTVVRNICWPRLRARHAAPLGWFDEAELPSREPSPEELLEKEATREWLWRALADLSEPLRLVTLLRYFSGVSSYEQIATPCGIPVGTVRSRLNQAKSAARATAPRLCRASPFHCS